MISLPVMFARDLQRLLQLPASQIVEASAHGRPIYGFCIQHAECAPDGSLLSFSLSRSGIELEIRDRRKLPAIARKAG